jgi:phage gpG-like protein
MSDGLTLDGADRLEQVAIALGDLGAGARQRLAAAIGLQTVLFEQVVKETKLSGQVLNRVTGLLVDRMFSEVIDDGDGIMGKVGTDTPYAAIHEFGGIIKHPGGTAYLVTAGGLAQFISNSSDLAANLPRTKPHDIPMPERSYLRSTLSERQAEIRDAMTSAVAGVA